MYVQRLLIAVSLIYLCICLSHFHFDLALPWLCGLVLVTFDRVSLHIQLHTCLHLHYISSPDCLYLRVLKIAIHFNFVLMLVGKVFKLLAFSLKHDVYGWYSRVFDHVDETLCRVSRIQSTLWNELTP
jgi:hypothetical protein